MQKLFFLSCISEARKFELSEIFERVIEIVEKHDPEALGINGMFQLLKAERSKLSKLTTVEARSFPDNDKVLQLVLRRKQVLNAIKQQALIVENATIASQEEFTHVIPVIKRYLKDFQKANQTEKSEKVNVFLNVLNETANKTAIAGLSMTIYVNELKTVQDAINTFTTSIKTVVVERVRSQSYEVKRSVINALRNLFKSIELASIEHTDKDYSKLIGELNNYLLSFNTTVKARRTRRMNIAKKETAASTPTSIATAN